MTGSGYDVTQSGYDDVTQSGYDVTQSGYDVTQRACTGSAAQLWSIRLRNYGPSDCVTMVHQTVTMVHQTKPTSARLQCKNVDNRLHQLHLYPQPYLYHIPVPEPTPDLEDDYA